MNYSLKHALFFLCLYLYHQFFQERIHLLESVKMISNNLTKLREEYEKTRQQVLHNVSTAQENSVNRVQTVCYCYFDKSIVVELFS